MSAADCEAGRAVAYVRREDLGGSGPADIRPPWSVDDLGLAYVFAYADFASLDACRKASILLPRGSPVSWNSPRLIGGMLACTGREWLGGVVPCEVQIAGSEWSDAPTFERLEQCLTRALREAWQRAGLPDDTAQLERLSDGLRAGCIELHYMVGDDMAATVMPLIACRWNGIADSVVGAFDPLHARSRLGPRGHDAYCAGGRDAGLLHG